MRRLAFVLAAFWASSCYAQRVSTPALNICDVLAHIEQYNHKRITLRGEYARGGHGLYLQGNSCTTPLLSKDTSGHPYYSCL